MNEFLTHIRGSENVFIMRIFLTVLILIFSLQSWIKAEEQIEYITKKKQNTYITKDKPTEFITKKKQSNYITKKKQSNYSIKEKPPEYITRKKKINKKNYKFLLLIPFGFVII